MANIPPHDTHPDTPKTLFKFIPLVDPIAPGPGEVKSTPFVHRKLAANPSVKNSLKHGDMDPASLEAELAESELIDVPGLVEHLFPDSLFPVPFIALYKAVRSKKWDTDLNNDWNAIFLRDYSGTSPGRVVNGRTELTEADLATFLDNLSETIKDAVHQTLPTATLQPRKTWFGKSETPLEGGPKAERKPDLCLVSDPGDHGDGADVSASWHSILVPFELESDADDHRKAFLQLINAAYMIFSTQDERRFVIGISLCGAADHDVRVYVFDRAGVVGSTKFDFSYDSALVRLVAGLNLCDGSRLGFDTTIRHDEHWGGSRLISVAGMEYQIIKTLFISDSIRGRGTVCWQARRDGNEYVIKNTWTDISRQVQPTEAEILRAADGIQGVAHLVAEEVVQVSGADDTTANVRSIIGRLGEFYRLKVWYEKLEVRVHRRLVMTPLAEPLTDFRTKRELLEVMIDAIKAHRRLVERHILHRDISINNILIQRVPLVACPPTTQSECGETADTSSTAPVQTDKPVEKRSVNGILIDLDHALITQDSKGQKSARSSSESDATGHRTGTLPFMATGILIGLEPGEEHQPHHDLESFFLILLWITLHYAGPGPDNVERRDIDVDKMYPVKTWLEGGSIRELGFQKESSMMIPDRSFNKSVGGLVTEYFKDLIPCINEMRGRIYTRDDGVPITHQEMIDIFQKHHDRLPEVEVWSRKDDEKAYRGSKRRVASIREEDEIGVAATDNYQDNDYERKRARTSVSCLLNLEQGPPSSPTSQAVVRKAPRAQRNSLPPQT